MALTRKQMTVRGAAAMRKQRSNDGNLDQVPFRMFNAFSNRLRDLVGFTQSAPHIAFSISYHHEGAEAEPSTSLHHFGHSVDMNHTVSQFQCAWIDFWQCLFLR